MDNTGLTNSDIEKIKAVLASYPAIKRVILYGSRAMGNYKPHSDIDFTLEGDDITLSIQQALENELDDLLLPWRFDVSVYNKLSNPDLINHINRVGKVFYERKE